MSQRPVGSALLTALSLGFLISIAVPTVSTAGIVTFTDRLPPFEGHYAGRGLHALFAFLSPAVVVEILDPIHTPDPLSVRCFDPADADPDEDPCRGAMAFTMPGEEELEEFSSSVSLVGCAFSGTVCEPFSGSGILARTKITLDTVGSGTRLFRTELLELTIGGMLLSMPFMLREDPDRVSAGTTFVVDLGGSRFRVDSFFDVFTELSLGGSPFVDGDRAGRVELVPEPAEILLVGLALLAWARHRRRPRTGRGPN